MIRFIYIAKNLSKTTDVSGISKKEISSLYRKVETEIKGSSKCPKKSAPIRN